MHPMREMVGHDWQIDVRKVEYCTGFRWIIS
jgi:hypothetical protein